MQYLKKRFGKDFVILNLTDIQLLSYNWINKESSYQLFDKIVKTLLEKYNPDLITITGDLVYREDYEGYRFLVQYMDALNVPWAPIFGNHDNESGYEVSNKQADILLKSKNCLFEKGNPNMGCGNYVVTVVGENNQLVEALFFMDTHDKIPYRGQDGSEKMVYASLNKDQLCWYREQIRNLKDKGCIDSSLFIHNPCNSFKLAIDESTRDGEIERMDEYNRANMATKDPYSPYINNQIWKDGIEASGFLNETVACFPDNDGVLDTIIEENNTRNIFAGHDHSNVCRVKYKGVWHNYCLKTGTGSFYAKHITGATIILIDDNGVRNVINEFIE